MNTSNTMSKNMRSNKSKSPQLYKRDGKSPEPQSRTTISKRQRRGHSPKNSKNSDTRRNNNNNNNRSTTPKQSLKSGNRQRANSSNPQQQQHQYPRSTKPYDRPMTKRDLYFAIDCEMVGVGPGGLRSALARVSVVNWDGDVVFDTHVKVPEPVTDYRTFVSGIRAEDIESDMAMDVDHCRAVVASLIYGKIIVGHGLQADLEVLGLSHPWCDVRDTAAYIPFMRVRTVGHEENAKAMMFPRRLKELAHEILGMEIQREGAEHCPVEDALAALELYKTCRVEWEMLMIAPHKTTFATPPSYPVQSKPQSFAPLSTTTTTAGAARFSFSPVELKAM